ncbi:MAG: GNAT family N-acetyltransferase [Pirellulaceae bacterium]
MAEIDLSDYEWPVVERPLTIDDYEELVALQEACFPGMKTWTREQIESQLRIFPEGQLCIVVDGKLAASASSLILNYDPQLDWHNWGAIADNGMIRNHAPKGDTLYGIEIMVSPEFRGMKLSRRLYDMRKQLCREKNLKRSLSAVEFQDFINMPMK